MLEVINDPVSDHIYIVLELVQGGPLCATKSKTDTVTPDVVFVWFRDIVAGVSYLHEQLVVHRDLKLENCLLTSDGHVKLCDFGFSHVFRDDEDGMLKCVDEERAPSLLCLLAGVLL